MIESGKTGRLRVLLGTARTPYPKNVDFKTRSSLRSRLTIAVVVDLPRSRYSFPNQVAGLALR